MSALLRRSLAAKLVLGALIVALLVVGSVGGYLVYSRATQAQGAAESTADNRVAVMVEVLDRFTGSQALSAATALAGQPALESALVAPDPASSVSRLLAAGSAGALDGEVLLVTDSRGRAVVARAASGVGTGATLSAAPAAVVAALTGGTCSLGPGTPVAGGCGVEILSDGSAAYDVAVPVSVGGRTVGAVAYVAPLAYQLDRFGALFSFPAVFIAADHPSVEVRSSSPGTIASDPSLRAALNGGGAVRHAVYATPAGLVAGSFRAVRSADGRVSGYIGVEVPVSSFAGDERTDILVVVLISLFILLMVLVATVLFVDRFVRRPVARLERGVARIAGGDYTTAIPVRTDDELGRLAGNVNRMRDSIAASVAEVEAAHRRLDEAVEQVGGATRALTTTTAGVAALQQAVVRAASSIGGGSRALLAAREGRSLVVTASEGGGESLSDWPGVDAVLSGDPVRIDAPAGGRLVAVPMFYQEDVVGALAIVIPADGGTASDADLGVLAVLANNAAIAMENARLFEQERDTVRRLLELDSMKSDFLATVQHELRTPLTAILGLADLLEMCWEAWADAAKVSAVRDIQVAARNLYDLVETIIDYAGMADERLGLNPTDVPVRAAVMSSLEAVGERHREGLSVPVDVEGEADVMVVADAARLVQVLKALIDNGQKFSEGRGRMRVGFGPDPTGSGVRIEVADQGTGIPPEEIPRIFDRFFQVDNSATRRFGGTGMGLALVKRLVVAHGARIDVTSEVGEGTRVVLTWPAARPREAAADGGVSDEAVAEHPGGTAVPVQ